MGNPPPLANVPSGGLSEPARSRLAAFRGWLSRRRDKTDTELLQSEIAHLIDQIDRDDLAAGYSTYAFSYAYGISADVKVAFNFADFFAPGFVKIEVGVSGTLKRLRTLQLLATPTMLKLRTPGGVVTNARPIILAAMSGTTTAVGLELAAEIGIGVPWDSQDLPGPTLWDTGAPHKFEDSDNDGQNDEKINLQTAELALAFLEVQLTGKAAAKVTRRAVSLWDSYPSWYPQVDAGTRDSNLATDCAFIGRIGWNSKHGLKLRAGDLTGRKVTKESTGGNKSSQELLGWINREIRLLDDRLAALPMSERGNVAPGAIDPTTALPVYSPQMEMPDLTAPTTTSAKLQAALRARTLTARALQHFSSAMPSGSELLPPGQPLRRAPAYLHSVDWVRGVGGELGFKLAIVKGTAGAAVEWHSTNYRIQLPVGALQTTGTATTPEHVVTQDTRVQYRRALINKGTVKVIGKEARRGEVNTISTLTYRAAVLRWRDDGASVAALDGSGYIVGASFSARSVDRFYAAGATPPPAVAKWTRVLAKNLKITEAALKDFLLAARSSYEAAFATLGDDRPSAFLIELGWSAAAGSAPSIAVTRTESGVRHPEANAVMQAYEDLWTAGKLVHNVTRLRWRTCDIEGRTSLFFKAGASALIDVKIKLADVEEWRLESATTLFAQSKVHTSDDEALAWGVPPAILLLQ